MNIASALQGVVAILWLLVIALIVLAVLRASRGQKIKASTTAILVLVGMALLTTLVSAGLVFIQPEDRGVVISALSPQGYREQALQPGLRWVIPFFENVVIYSISQQNYTMSIAAGEGQRPGDDSVTARTSDGQEILLDASIIYAIDPARVVQVHITWQNRYTEELVRPQARGVIRDAVSQYGVEEVVTSQRFELQQAIEEAMQQKFAQNGLVMSDFILRNITFSPEYAASVEQKQIAEQLAQQAAFVVEQRRQEAEQARQTAQGQADAAVIRAQGEAQSRIIQAEAEAEALEKIANALQDNQDLLTYQYINRLAPGIQVMLVPNDTPFLLPLPTLEGSTSSNPTPAPTELPTP